MKMAKITIGFGILLTLLGLGAYVGSGAASFTALIPSFFGVALLILGYLGLKENLRKHSMRVGALIGVLGFLGSASGLAKIFTLLSGCSVERPTAVIVQSIMATVCAVYVWLSIRSFIKARRNQAASKTK